MTHWTQVFSYEMRQQFRRRAYLFITFGVPLLALLAFFGYQAYQDANQGESGEAGASTPAVTEQHGGTTVGYVDLTPQSLFPPPESYEAVDCALQQLVTSPYCLQRLVISYGSFEAGRAALDDGTIDALYVVEPDFAETGDISEYMTGFSLEATNNESLFHDYMIRSLLASTSADAETSASLYLRLRNPAFVATNQVSESGAAQQENQDQNFLLVYGFGLGMMLSVFWGGGYLMQSVVQEKESRIIEIILSSVRPTALLAGKIFAMGLASLLQVGLLVGTFIYLGNRASSITSAIGDLTVEPQSVVLMVVYFVLGFLLLGSLMAGIGAIVSNVRESQNFVTFVTLPAAVPFFFTTVFATEPNSTLAVALSLFPLTAPLSMVMRLAVTDVPVAQLGLSLILLVLAVVAGIWMAGRLFRVRILLTGTTPKLRDFPTLLRG